MRRMAVLMAVAFVDMIGLMLVLPLLALYALHLHASATTIGFLTAAFTGEASSWATGKAAVRKLMVVALACKCSAYSANRGRTSMSPIMSTKATAMRTDIRFIVSRAPSPDQRCGRFPGRRTKAPPLLRVNLRAADSCAS